MLNERTEEPASTRESATEYLRRRWPTWGTFVCAFVAVIASGLVIALVGAVAFVAHCNEDLDLNIADDCEKAPTVADVVLVGAPGVLAGLALVLAHGGRRSRRLAVAGAALAIAGAVVTWVWFDGTSATA